MIRVAHISGSRSGESFSSPGPLVRVGRSAGCDLRYDGDREPRVSYHHAELVLDGGRWFVVDTDSEHGVLVNGARVKRHPLRPGDRIAFGAGGPEVRVQAADASAAGAGDRGGLSAMRQEAYRVITSELGMSDEDEEGQGEEGSGGEEEEGEGEEEGEDGGDGGQDAEGEDGERVPPPGVPPARRTARSGGHSQSAASLAEEVAKRVAEERARAGGQSSGQTTFIMADAIEAANREERRRTRQRWVRIVSAVAAGAVLLTSGLGVVIYRQRRQLDALVAKKHGLDEEILAVQRRMSEETDEVKLFELEQQLQSLTGRAESARDELGEMGKSSRQAAEVAQQDSGDELDREIRAVLRKFNADTYAVPPIFKERLRFHIDWLVTRKNWPQSQERWRRYWPMVRKAFRANEMPEELGYIAYVESQFDADAYNDKASARGMWQFIPATARTYGLRVDDKVDDRVNPEKAAQAAARYLSFLLGLYGEQSFMLALASYNWGEQGVQKVLLKVARQPGGYKKRDFWHLYRMKLIPEETREYVPAVIAAAIVFSNPLHYGGPTLPEDEGAPGAPPAANGKGR